MPVVLETELQQAYDISLSEWSQPNKNFTSGFDPRSSVNALLVLMYGGLQHAASHNWLNAGRRLIDKTYIQILLNTQGDDPLDIPTADSIAVQLDDFILKQLAPRWLQIINPATAEKHKIADELVSNATKSLFGSQPNNLAARIILSYLCPHLPIYPFSSELDKHLISRCQNTIQNQQTFLNNMPLPEAIYGQTDQVNAINNMLKHSDWWQRHITVRAVKAQQVLN